MNDGLEVLRVSENEVFGEKRVFLCDVYIGVFGGSFRR